MGLVPRVFQFAFDRIRQAEIAAEEGGKETSYVVKVMMLEIYNERMTDLLNPDSAQLEIQEDVRRGIGVQVRALATSTCPGHHNRRSHMPMRFELMARVMCAGEGRGRDEGRGRGRHVRALHGECPPCL